MEDQQLISSLKDRLKMLIDQHRHLTTQVRSLEVTLSEKNRELQQSVVDKEALNHEVKELKDHIKTIKLAQSITNAGESDQNSRQVKAKINEYIREIDRCLSLLNRE